MKYIFPFEKNYYIYKITNTRNKKIYIGRTKNPSYRRNQHISKALNQNNVPTQKIHLAIKEMGVENFCFEVFEKYNDYSIACEQENYWIKHFKSDEDEFGYNDKSGPELGVIMWNENDRKRMSIRMSGKNNPMFGKSKSKKIIKQLSQQFSGSNNPFYGKKHNEKTLKLISESSKYRISGENNPHAKLNLKIVSKIREDWKTGNFTKVSLSKKYKVTAATIGHIISGKTWK